jgi:hypothetical protein
LSAYPDYSGSIPSDDNMQAEVAMIWTGVIGLTIGEFGKC